MLPRWQVDDNALSNLQSPRGHTFKSLALASNPQVLESYPVLGSRTALFFEPLKFFIGKRQKPRGKFANTFFVFLFYRSPEKFS